MVGFLQLEILNGQENETEQGAFGDFRENIKALCAKRSIPLPDLSDERISRLRRKIARLLKTWWELPSGQTLALRFDPSSFAADAA